MRRKPDVSAILSNATLATKVCDFFLRNPGEELDVDSISVKWGVPRCSVHSELSNHLDAKLLSRDAGEEHGYIYRRGKRLTLNNLVVMNA